VGSQKVSEDLTITLFRLADSGFLLSYSAYGLGDFRISPDGSEIRWRPGDDPWVDALRWVLMGWVMATAMYAGGTLCMHGSAVLLQEQGICFLAPKFHGKSTLAGALVARGAALATDDVLPVDPGPPAVMYPGVPVLRLLEDSERAVALAGRTQRRTEGDVGKARIDFLEPSELMPGPRPLSAIYILTPERDEPGPGRAVVRERLGGMEALRALLPHSSIAVLLSAAEVRLLLSHTAALVRTVPIFRLRAMRDLDRLPEVVAQLQRWHLDAAPAGVADVASL
jgi:hypothetical protein